MIRLTHLHIPSGFHAEKILKMNDGRPIIDYISPNEDHNLENFNSLRLRNTKLISYAIRNKNSFRPLSEVQLNGQQVKNSEYCNNNGTMMRFCKI